MSAISRGNRTLNHAIHMIAVTQIRNPDSEGRGYYDRKVAAGCNSRVRCARSSERSPIAVYKHLQADRRNK